MQILMPIRCHTCLTFTIFQHLSASSTIFQHLSPSCSSGSPFPWSSPATCRAWEEARAQPCDTPPPVAPAAGSRGSGRGKCCGAGSRGPGRSDGARWLRPRDPGQTAISPQPTGHLQERAPSGECPATIQAWSEQYQMLKRSYQ